MKKKVLIVATVMASLASFAQEKAADASSGEELKGRKGQPILPKGGDIALGFNAVPMFDWILDAAGRNQNGNTPTVGNAVNYTSNSNNQIVGKYYLDATTAVRVRFGINNIAGSVTNKVQDAIAMGYAVNGTNDDIEAAKLFQVDDKMTFKKGNTQIAIGFEKRRGYGRIQGFYGAEIGFGRSASSMHVAYGNAFSDKYVVDYTSDWNGNPSTSTQNPTDQKVSRVLDVKYQTGIRYGARAFVGVEYFFLPKMSVGAEFGWGYSVETRGKQTDSFESYVQGNNGPTVITENHDQLSSSKSRGWSVDNNQNTPFSMNNASSVPGFGTNSNTSGNNGLNGGSAAIILLIHF